MISAGTGAMVFAQESMKLMFEHHGEKTLAEGGGKKGTLIFTGTMGALRCNAEFGSYGASRGSVRQLAQALAKEVCDEDDTGGIDESADVGIDECEGCSCCGMRLMERTGMRLGTC